MFVVGGSGGIVNSKLDSLLSLSPFLSLHRIPDQSDGGERKEDGPIIYNRPNKIDLILDAPSYVIMRACQNIFSDIFTISSGKVKRKNKMIFLFCFLFRSQNVSNGTRNVVVLAQYYSGYGLWDIKYTLHHRIKRPYFVAIK